MHVLDSAHEIDGKVSDDSHVFLAMAGSQAGLIVAEGDVEHPVQAVLDGPMIAGELQQPCRIELVGGQAGDGLDHLARAAVLQLADALDAADGCDAWPILVEAKG